MQDQTVTVLARFLGISGFIPLILLIFYTKICIGINDRRLEKCSSFGTVMKMNYFSGSFSSKSDKTISLDSYFSLSALNLVFYYSVLAFYY